MHEMQIWRQTSFSSMHKTRGIVRLHEREFAPGFCPFLNQEHNHDQTEVETPRDDEDLPSPLSPAQHSCWREELHKVSKMCRTYFSTRSMFSGG